MLTGLQGAYFGGDDPRNVAVLIVYQARSVEGDIRAGDDAADARFFARGSLPEHNAFQGSRDALADWEKRRRFRPWSPVTREPPRHADERR